jgi:hypothetical protein
VPQNRRRPRRRARGHVRRARHRQPDPRIQGLSNSQHHANGRKAACA